MSSSAGNATVAIAPFRVSDDGFDSECFDEDELVEFLQEEVATQCRKNGLRVVEEREADVRIQGMIVEVDDGSQLLRWLIPFLAGAAVVHVKGTITLKGQDPEPFRQVHRCHFGLFGGNSKDLIRVSLRRVGLFLASEAAAQVNPSQSLTGGHVARYFVVAGVVALLVAVLLAGGVWTWALSLPQTNNSIKRSEVPLLALVVAGAAFGGLCLGALATAPSRILNHRSMIWLISLSGVNSLIGVRIILGLLALVAAVVCLGAILVAPG